MLRGSFEGRGARQGLLLRGYHHSGFPNFRWDWNNPNTYTFHNRTPPQMPPKRARSQMSRRANRYFRGSLQPAYADKYQVRGVRTVKKYKKYPVKIALERRLRRNMPVTITHEETSEIRSPMGSQGITTYMAERRFPQIIQGGAGLPDTTDGTLNPSVNRDSNNNLAVHNGVANEFMNTIYRYEGTTVGAQDARSLGMLNHRSDWTMFTNASWRDGYSTLNGRFTTGGLAYKGYRTPVEGTAVQDATWYQRAISRIYDAADSTLPSSTLQCTDYYHLMESLSVTVTNNTVVPTTVCLWECVLNHDVGFTSTLSLDTTNPYTTSWGALPCPLELYRISKQVYGVEFAGILPTETGEFASNTSGVSAVYGNDGPGTTCTVQGAPREPVKSGYAIPVMSSTGIYTGVPDIDHPASNPLKAKGPLNYWYTLKPHKRMLAPGQSTTISVKIMFNKRIAAVDWTNRIGVKGLSRAFFITSRPQKMVGSTGIDEAGFSGNGSRLPVMGNTDLTLKWVKSKQFARSAPALRHRLFYRAAIPEVDQATARNPQDHDAEDDGDQALGGDA